MTKNKRLCMICHFIEHCYMEENQMLVQNIEMFNQFGKCWLKDHSYWCASVSMINQNIILHAPTESSGRNVNYTGVINRLCSDPNVQYIYQCMFFGQQLSQVRFGDPTALSKRPLVSRDPLNTLRRGKTTAISQTVFPACYSGVKIVNI